MGRQTECTPEIAERLAETVREVGFVKPACMLIGLPISTHNQWMEKGEAALEAGDVSSPYYSYADTIKKAVADWQLRKLGKIDRGEQGWQSAAWGLERSDFATYGTRQAVEHSGSVSTGVAPIATPAELDEQRRAMRERYGAH